MRTSHSIRTRMVASGIGFAGIDGAWWLPSAQPFTLPAHLHAELGQIGQAIFLLFDTVLAHYGTPAGAAAGLNQLLTHKVPAHIPRLTAAGNVLSVRPDFQLVTTNTPAGYQLVATELEICPSAQGFAHAMQVGYGLPTDLVKAFARLLGERDLLLVGTSQWSEFLIEQLAFCRALAQVGIRARVLYDQPMASLLDEVQQEKRWQPPIFGVQHKPPGWDSSVWPRLRQRGLDQFLWPGDESWPTQVGNALVFRFGYFDCFAPAHLQQMIDWQAHGATFVNPTHFALDSKVILAAMALPAVRNAIAAQDDDALSILDGVIPTTRLLVPALLPQLLVEKDEWILKFAGYDSGNQAWGGRSLQIGAQQSADDWHNILQYYLALPFPVVAQRMATSAQVDIAYLAAQEQVRWLRNGTTRLRAFLLRDPQPQANNALVGGAHITVSGGTRQVSEATDAVQAPVQFI